MGVDWGWIFVMCGVTCTASNHKKHQHMCVLPMNKPPIQKKESCSSMYNKCCRKVCAFFGVGMSGRLLTHDKSSEYHSTPANRSFQCSGTTRLLLCYNVVRVQDSGADTAKGGVQIPTGSHQQWQLQQSREWTGRVDFATARCYGFAHWGKPQD